MTVLGSGNLGTAILNGLLSSLPKDHFPTQTPTPAHLPSHFIACVHSPASVSRVEASLANEARLSSAATTVWHGRNLEAVRRASIILLACQPRQAASILADAPMRAALAGKLLLSICVGVSAAALRRLIYGSEVTDDDDNPCHIVHVMPNTASGIRQSSTIISTAEVPLPAELDALATWVFESIGAVTKVPVEFMNAASVAAASTPAFFALALDGVVRGAVEEGVREEDAVRMAAQAMKGAAELVLRGQSPREVMERVMTPKGCTVRGVNVLDAGRVRETYTDAIRQATARVVELGKESAGVVGMY
ncbi:delta 1-pyrroline-5-carboxylate reductase [Xylographa pallens]|nr:delta 1-pyrroline-5-carboxylate reductase [Xylographa pallens]